jgi:hypothetical protein
VPDSDDDDTSGNGGAVVGCFIATAAYSSSVEPYVKILSEFRDRYLFESSIGMVGLVSLRRKKVKN